MLKTHDIEGCFFIDQYPPASGIFLDLPVFSTEQALRKDFQPFKRIDALFLAFMSDKLVPLERLHNAHFKKPVIIHKENSTLNSMLKESAFTLVADDPFTFLSRILAFDGGSEDVRYLQAAEDFLMDCPHPLAFYGAGKLCSSLLEHSLALRTHITCIIDDAPSKQGLTIKGVPVLSWHERPHSLQTIFISVSATLDLAAIRKHLQDAGNKAACFTLEDINRSAPDVVPSRARGPRPLLALRPEEIPPIHFQPKLDIILLDLPPRQPPMRPYGLGFVHNTLQKTGVRFQTVDLNIIMYHRYRTRLLLDGKAPRHWPANVDPWNYAQFDKWEDSRLIEHFQADLDEIIHKLTHSKPRILGISLHAPNRLLAETIIQEVKKKQPDTVILVGGYDCVSRHTALSKFRLFDYMLIGEAEETLPPLIKSILSGQPPRNIPGVVTRKNGLSEAWQEGPWPNDLDAVGFPTYEWNADSVYRNSPGGDIIPFSISRGCRWSRCNFCGERFPFRRREPARVVEEIAWHVARGYTSFTSMESDINGDPETLLAVCRELIRRDLKVSLYGQLRIDPRNDLEFFQTLKKAGFSTVLFGVDGWCDHVLRLQRKGYTMKTVEQNLRFCHQAGLRAHVNMVIGVPGETEEDIHECVANIIKNKEYIHVFATINMVRLIAGSPYYANPDRHHIRFRGDPRQIYPKDPNLIDERLWYSTKPYIDHHVRLKRYTSVCRQLVKAGIRLGEFAKQSNIHEIAKIEGKEINSFDEALGIP